MRALALVAVLVSGCGTSVPVAAPSPEASPVVSPVGSHYSPAAPFPGTPWTKDGRAVANRELNAIAGPEHCDWQSATFLHLGWPLGTVSQHIGQVHQFLRDPQGVIGATYRDRLGLQVALPPDASDTGYRQGDVELWLRDAEPDAAYLRAGDDVERWPRADPAVACA
jgi:hypothetical protein